MHSFHISSFHLFKITVEETEGYSPVTIKINRARHTQMRDRASGVHPDILEHLPPKKKPESAYCIALGGEMLTPDLERKAILNTQKTNKKERKKTHKSFPMLEYYYEAI